MVVPINLCSQNYFCVDNIPALADSIVSLKFYEDLNFDVYDSDYGNGVIEKRYNDILEMYFEQGHGLISLVLLSESIELKDPNDNFFVIGYSIDSVSQHYPRIVLEAGKRIKSDFNYKTDKDKILSLVIAYGNPEKGWFNFMKLFFDQGSISKIIVELRPEF